MQRDVQSLSDHATYLSNKITFLLDAMLGVVNIEQNNIIKIFSVAAVVLMPPTLIASIYGMNFKHMPELDWTFGYPLAIGADGRGGGAALFLSSNGRSGCRADCLETERAPRSKHGPRKPLDPVACVPPQTCWPPLMWISAPFT